MKINIIDSFNILQSQGNEQLRETKEKRDHTSKIYIYWNQKL